MLGRDQLVYALNNNAAKACVLLDEIPSFSIYTKLWKELYCNGIK